MRPAVFLIASIAIVGANSLALSPLAVSVASSFAEVSPSDVMLTSALYGGGTAASALLLAPGIDRIGLGKSLVMALAVLAIALLATALSPSLDWVLAWQTLAGIGAGVALPAVYGLAVEQAPEGQGSAYLGKVLTGWTLSMVFGVTIAAIIADFAGWRSVYLILSAAAVFVLRALVKQGYFRSTSSQNAVSSPFAALKVPGIYLALMVCAAYMAAFYGLYAFLGPHLQIVLGLTTSAAGLGPLAYGLGFGVAAVLGTAIDRYGPDRVSPYVFGALICVYLSLGLASRSSTATIALCLLWGIINHLGLNLIVARLVSLDLTRRGAILGLYSAVTYVAMTIGTAVFRIGYDSHGFFFCTLLSAGCILPALLNTLMAKAPRTQQAS